MRSLQLELLPGARELLALHDRELPQRDDLFGAFCGALALRAGGVERAAGEPLDQDAVALHVDDVAAARERLEAEGVPFPMDTFDTGVCHMAFFTDPDGNALMLHHNYVRSSTAASAR